MRAGIGTAKSDYLESTHIPDHELIETYFDVEETFDIAAHIINACIGPDVKMVAPRMQVPAYMSRRNGHPSTASTAWQG